jgi:putative membrane protein
MVLVPVVLGLLPQGTVDWGLGLILGWNDNPARGLLMTLLFVKLAAVFLIVRYALAWMPLRMALTPAATKTRRVRRRAIELFRIAAEKKTRGRTGILLYLSLLEHRAEIVADEAIHSKVEPDVWAEAMAALIENVKAGRPGEGMALAVEKIGAVLAEHLPHTHDDNPNELPDRLIEI